jgi:hypothetical protein
MRPRVAPSDRTEQDEQRRTHIAEEKLSQRHKRHADPCVRLRILLRQSRADGSHLLLRLRHGASGFQSPHDPDKRPAATLRIVGATRSWSPQLTTRREFELRWHDPHDRRRLIVEGQLSSDDVSIAAKVALPPLVAEDHDRAAALLIFLREERAAEERLDAQCFEKAGRHDP